jgi:hypothetical protein
MTLDNDYLNAIGVGAYERSFGLRFIHESDVASVTVGLDPKVRVIPSNKRIGYPPELRFRGRSVAIVGNSTVVDCGPMIDSHDVVIRMTTMRNWKKSKQDDGEKITIWAGQPVFVFQGTAEHPEPLPVFREVVKNGVDLWANSPFHVSLEAFAWFTAQGGWDRLHFAPPPFALYDAMCLTHSAQDLRLIFSPAPEKRFLVGLVAYELLLTGTRVALLLDMLGVSRISLFGFDLFTSAPGQLWFGHSVDVDWQVLQIIKRRSRSDGRDFYWHEEASISQAFGHLHASAPDQA